MRQSGRAWECIKLIVVWIFHDLVRFTVRDLLRRMLDLDYVRNDNP